MLRGVSLTNFAEVASFVGLDAEAILRRVGLDLEALDDPDRPIPASDVVKLFKDAADESGCATFGRLMSECRTLASLGPASLLLRHQPTIRAMMGAAIRIQRHFGDVVNMTLEEDGETAILRWDFLPEFAGPQWVEYSVAIAVRAFCEVARGRWYPEVVYFTHLAPPETRMRDRAFACPLEFDADFNGLSCPSAALDVPNALASPALTIHAERLLGLIPTERQQGSVTESARHAIYLLIHSGAPSIDRVGRALGMHPRTLQRMLEREGRSFGDLLNETRRELAQRYLVSPHHSLATISKLAGYSSQSAFTRWFAGEFGQSPAVWREQAGCSGATL